MGKKDAKTAEKRADKHPVKGHNGKPTDSAFDEAFLEWMKDDNFRRAFNEYRPTVEVSQISYMLLDGISASVIREARTIEELYSVVREEILLGGSPNRWHLLVVYEGRVNEIASGIELIKLSSLDT